MNIQKLTGAKVVAAVGVFWVIGQVLTSSIFPNIGYTIFVLTKICLPFCLTLFLYMLALIREKDSPGHRLAIHIPFGLLLIFVLRQGFLYFSAYERMDDAPRGLLWDIYNIEALIIGSLILWVPVAWRRFAIRRKIGANNASQVTSQ